MSKLSELVEAQQRESVPAQAGMKIDVCANCSVCYRDVDEAEYFSSHRVLKYVCSDGHVSYLEDFNL
jgi:hypothetical protein